MRSFITFAVFQIFIIIIIIISGSTALVRTLAASHWRRLTDILFIRQVIFEHGERWWNDMDRRKLQILPLNLSGSPTSRIV
jgi:hypothetical protein